MSMIKKTSPQRKVIAVGMFLTLITGGCATSQNQTIALPTYKPSPLKAPIEERKETKLPPKVGAPLVLMACQTKKGEAATQDCSVPFNGILIDQNYAARAKLYKAERDTLRTMISADRVAFSATHKLHEEAINELARRADRSWLERHKGTLGFWGGLTLGMGLAVLTVFGISKAESAAK